MVPQVRRLALLSALVALLALPATAQATFPGENGKIALNGVDTINPDGTGRTHLTPGFAPAWSPDGSRIAFVTARDGNSEIYVMNADSSGQQRLTSNPALDTSPSWAPDGQRIAFQSDRDGNDELYVMNADGSAPTRITNTAEDEWSPKWSPSGAWIAFQVGAQIYTIAPDGTQRTHRLGGESPSWAPDGQVLWSHYTYYDEVVEDYYNAIQWLNVDTGEYSEHSFEHQAVGPVVSPDNRALLYFEFGTTYIETETSTRELVDEAATDWQAVQRPHARPKSASPHLVPLVTAFQECTAPNREHGPPLAHPSCNPPQPASPNVVVSAGEVGVNSVGSVRLSVIIGPPGGPDDADVRLRLRLTSVKNQSDLSDYTGVLQPELRIRLTDRDGIQRQTTQDFPFRWAVPCAATAGTEGATCALTTTAEAVLPGSVTEGKRAIWGLDRVKVYDGGPAGDGQDASLFAVQGVFIP